MAVAPIARPPDSPMAVAAIHDTRGRAGEATDWMAPRIAPDTAPPASAAGVESTAPIAARATTPPMGKPRNPSIQRPATAQVLFVDR